MTITVTGLEGSGTNWMSGLLRLHPEVSSVIHTSLPEHGGENTRWPDLTGSDRIVWMLRYEPFRLKSVNIRGYECGRNPRFVPPELYSQCSRIYKECQVPIVFGHYEALVGPIRSVVFNNMLKQLGLGELDGCEQLLNAVDANRKYMPIVSWIGSIHSGQTQTSGVRTRHAI